VNGEEVMLNTNLNVESHASHVAIHNLTLLAFPDRTSEAWSLNLFMTPTRSMCATSFIIMEVLNIILRISLL